MFIVGVIENEDDKDPPPPTLLDDDVRSVNLESWRFFSNVFCEISSLSTRSCSSFIKFLDSLS